MIPLKEGFHVVFNVIIRHDRIAYIGLRDVDDGERKLIKDLNLKVPFPCEPTSLTNLFNCILVRVGIFYARS